MKFMNEYDIGIALLRHRRHPILGPAALILHDLMELTNSCSDGWPYWSAPCKSAKKLMELLEDTPPEGVTEKALKAAITPIKAMLTKHSKTFGGKTINFKV